MGKLKTNKTAKKRFKRTKGGKGDILIFKNGKSHLRTGRSTRWKRRTNNKRQVSEVDTKRMIKLISN